jgi:hypothetical protein
VLLRHVLARSAVARTTSAQHRGDRVVAAEDRCGITPPRGALLELGARRVLALAGIRGRLGEQARLLGEVRRTSVPRRELGRQLLLPGRDHLSLLRPEPGQSRIDADDLAHGPLAAIVRTLGEPHTEPRRQQSLEPRVVTLGHGHRRLVQRPPVEREPSPISGLHLVRDRNVRVQTRVAGARVAVRERDGEQPARVHLLGPAGTDARVDGLALEPADDVAHCSVVRGRDLTCRRRIGQRPQRRHALDRRERQVVAGDRPLARPGRADDVVGQLARVDRLAAVIADEPVAGQLGPQACPVLVGERRVRPLTQFVVARDDSPRELAPEFARRPTYRERLAEARVHLGSGRGGALLEHVRIWVPAMPEQRDHLRLVDHVARPRPAV